MYSVFFCCFHSFVYRHGHKFAPKSSRDIANSQEKEKTSNHLYSNEAALDLLCNYMVKIT